MDIFLTKGMKLRGLLITVLMLAACAASSEEASPTPAISPSALAPNVSLEEVEDLFGSNLEYPEPEVQELLLAIGMERTSTGSRFREERIGVPYIVYDTPVAWVSRYRTGDKSVDTLVNMALVMMISKSKSESTYRVGVDLLRKAAEKGYWPASAFTAGEYLRQAAEIGDKVGNNRFRDESIESKRMLLLGKLAMEHLNRCAEAGFAPCQYRIGFWLANSADKPTEGVEVLRHAIKSTLQDNRYQGYVDESFFHAVQVIYDLGESAGLSHAMREQYRGLLEGYSKGSQQSLNM